VQLRICAPRITPAQRLKYQKFYKMNEPGGLFAPFVSVSRSATEYTEERDETRMSKPE